MYAYPSTPQVWGTVTKATCLEELIDLVDLAHDLGHDERDFWIREGGVEFHIGIARRNGNMFRLRYKHNNTIEIGGIDILARRLGDALAEDVVFSAILEQRSACRTSANSCVQTS